MLPVQKEMDTIFYFLKPFEYETWILIVIFEIFLSIFDLFFYKLVENKFDFGYSFLTTLSLTLNISPPFRNTKNIQIHIKRFLNMILGFMLSNMYLAILYKSITNTLPPIKINNWKEFNDSNIKILLSHDYITELKQIDLPINLKLKSIETSNHEFEKLRFDLNTSYGYIATSHQSNFIMLMGQDSRKPKFYYTDLCFTNRFHAIFLRTGSMFGSLYNRFLRQAMDTGLLELWIRKGWENANKLGFKKYPESSKDYNMLLKFKHYKFSIIVLSIGFLISSFCFIYEVVFGKSHQPNQIK